MKTESIFAWRFFNRDEPGTKRKFKGKLRSVFGDTTWPEDGTWLTHKGDLRICHQGFHASRDIKSAFQHRKGTVLGLVECQGVGNSNQHTKDLTKFVVRKMRVVNTYSHKHLIALALWCAIKKLPDFEKANSEKLPRQVIKTIIKGFKESVDLNVLSAKVQNKINKINKTGQPRDYSQNSPWSSLSFTYNLIRAAGGRLPASSEKPAQIKQSTAQNVNYIVSALASSQIPLFNTTAEKILGLPKEALGDWFSELLDKQDSVKHKKNKIEA